MNVIISRMNIIMCNTRFELLYFLFPHQLTRINLAATNCCVGWERSTARSNPIKTTLFYPWEDLKIRKTMVKILEILFRGQH